MNQKIEDRISFLLGQLNCIERVLGPNTLNSSSLSIIKKEIDEIEMLGANVLTLRNNYVFIQTKVRIYSQRKNLIY